MSCNWIRTIVIGILILFPCTAHSQNGDSSLHLQHVKNCVYEVVVPKPVEDPLSYEKPLPMDLIPFVIRNDKYIPIGSAFAINATEFVTAVHVMGMGLKTQFREILLRDIKGNLLHIDTIMKFSSRRDFVVFTVKEKPSGEHFDVNTSPKMNGKVYAVGNALGQGIVIRDGLYTSDTPEDVEGKWNWMRFSAAASPGNSGGPLLDKDGKVIGLVVMKSPNENLNIALPISEVLKDYPLGAEIYQKAIWRLDIMDGSKTGTLDTQMALPMDYQKFSTALTDMVNGFISKLSQDFMSENKGVLFPNGDASSKLMCRSAIYDFPHLVGRGEDGSWDTFYPSEIKDSDLENSGRLSYGTMGHTTYLRIEKPSDITLKDLFSDSKRFMDYVLKGMKLTRTIGPEKIRITSLGQSNSEYTHTDSYGRKWLVKTWLLAYSDQAVIAFILPTPDGCIALCRLDQTGKAVDQYVVDLNILADYIYVSFQASPQQWREYMELKDLHPAVFNDIQLTINDGSIRYKSKRFTLTLDPGAIKVTDNSLLQLGFGYYKDNDAVVWDVTRLYLAEDRYKSDGVGISRCINPAGSKDRRTQDAWQKLVTNQQPYDMKIYIEEGNTEICSMPQGVESTKPKESCSVLYYAWQTRSGVVEQADMETGLNKILQNLTVHEN